jgi:hypothetical protein
MIDLNVRIEAAEAVPLAATPQLCFKLRIDIADGCKSVPIQSVLLRVQLRIEPTRRGYPTGFQAGLSDLFGEPQRWGATMRSLLWTHANLLVPSFTASTLVDLPIECTFDFNVAATKYFSSLDDGDVPLCFLFSGTCFYQTDRGLQAAQISWEREANFRLPVQIWKEMMSLYYPNCAWLCLDKEAFARLHEFKSRHAIPTWEQAIERLLPEPVADAASIEG